jgi:hypothetical protein
MLELVRLVQATLVAALLGRRRLVVENLLLRQHVPSQVALRSQRRPELGAVADVFFMISYHRRRLLHFDVTAHPTAAWVWRQVIEATPWGQQPSYLIHDRDRVYGADFSTRLGGLAIRWSQQPPKM